MAQTDARAGFRLPWNSERPNSEDGDSDLVEGQEPTDATAATESSPDAEQTAIESFSDGEQTAPDASASTPGLSIVPDGPRKSSKFMVDLSKAMQVAAEEARAQSLDQFAAEAKAYIEQIHARSTDEAADLRRQADDDVAAFRESSKAEIARIREETDARVGRRKADLESEVEEHTAQIEREIERVRTRVAAFETEMSQFFERLLSEDDPTRIARMAERLPEPTPFDEMSAPAAYTPEPSHEAPAEEVTAEPEPPAAEAADAGWVETSEITTDVSGEVAADATNDAPGDVTENTEIDREAAFAAIQEAAEAAADTGDAPAAVDFADTTERTAESDTGGEAAMADAEADPRLAALALAAGFDAAELEAKASADATPDSEEIPEIGNEALAARLAGLVPEMSENSSPSETRSTQVVVVGLVSVASIASFKRTLGRLPGISSVGVSSGPDGEFLFAVTHSNDVVLSEAIPGMPAFRARVTGSGEGTLNVTAHDPDSDK